MSTKNLCLVSLLNSEILVHTMEKKPNGNGTLCCLPNRVSVLPTPKFRWMSELDAALHDDAHENAVNSKADMIFKTHVKEYKVHSLVVAINSKKLEKQFNDWSASNVNTGAKCVVDFTGEEDEVVENFIPAMYGGMLETIENEIWETYLKVCLFALKWEAFTVRNYFRETLRKVCGKDLVASLDLVNHLFKSGITFEWLIDMPLRSIARNFKTITEKYAANWRDLETEVLAQLLMRDDLWIDSEFELYQLVLKYAKYWKPYLVKKRKSKPPAGFNVKGVDYDQLMTVVKHIRFTNMTTEQFASVLMDNILDAEEIAWVTKYNAGVPDAKEHPKFCIEPRVYIKENNICSVKQE